MMEEVQKYFHLLLNLSIKYTWWVGESFSDTPHPFYLNEMPTDEYLKENGTNCAGFINLLRHFTGRSVPGEGEWRGGTGGWYDYLSDQGVLEKFDVERDYPIGTLFLRQYRDIEDQGHVAVYYSPDSDSKTVLNGTIIHSYSDEEGGRIGLTPMRMSHYWDSEEGYYEYAVLPENWLFTK